MLIWLKHPAHGVKDCYSDAEASACEKNGWERFDPKSHGDDQIRNIKKELNAAFETHSLQYANPRRKPGPKPKAKG